jgi:lysophospholipase L1-like esterase
MIRTRRRRLHALVAVVLAVGASIATLELAVRVARPDLPFTEPAHDVLFLNPDRRVGWKHPAEFSFFWNGRNPYCIEFRVQIATNRFGFRDRARQREKGAGAIRIAVLGDSFIEAIQVPMQGTATALLEEALAQRFPGTPIEVMNFGVSNYSIGQYLLQYEAYVRPFDPDFVVVFASYLNFSRTVQRELSSRLQAFYALNVRPSFELGSAGELMPIPAADYDAYSRQVDGLVQDAFGSDRAMEIAPIWTPLALPHWVLNVLSRKARPSASPQRREVQDFPDLDVNYRILETLYEKVQGDDAVLVFADAFEYLERYGVVRGSGALAARNRAFFEKLGAGYIDLSPALRETPANPQFECDMHFSADGNRVIAGALGEWFVPELTRQLRR